MVIEKKERKPRVRRDPTETPEERTKRVRRDKIKKEVRADLKEKKKQREARSKFQPYTGKCQVGDIIIFKFAGGIYKGRIEGKFESTDWAEESWKVISGDTTYPVQPVAILDKVEG